MQGSVQPSEVQGTEADGTALESAKPRFRGRLHQAAFFAAIPAGVVLVAAARATSIRVAAIVYALSLVGLYGVSAAYHRRTWSPRSLQRMKRADHSMIFVLIAGTTTPVALVALQKPWSWIVLVAVWVGAGLGIRPQAPERRWVPGVDRNALHRTRLAGGHPGPTAAARSRTREHAARGIGRPHLHGRRHRAPAPQARSLSSGIRLQGALACDGDRRQRMSLRGDIADRAVRACGELIGRGRPSRRKKWCAW